MITSFFLCYFYYFGLYGVTSWRQIIWYIILEYCKEYNFCQQPFNQIFYCNSHTHFVMGCRLIHKVDEPAKPNLDKEITSYNDVFDAFRLAMKMFHFRSKDDDSRTRALVYSF